jgi:N-acetylneuraminic acid mutarotase
MMADLPGEPGVILLGGADAPGPPDLPDMWMYDPEAGWRDVTPGTVPQRPEYGDGVIGNGFSFDLRSGKAVFVDIEGHPWVYDRATNVWEARETEAGPTELLGASMVYDAGSDRMIVFGGFMIGSDVNAQTWAYDTDSNTWEPMHPKPHPSARNYYSMAYDAESDRVILFGGDDGVDVLGDTWAYDYDSDSWTNMTPTRSPASRDYSWMVYDSSGDRMLLFGGSNDMETATFDDTWTYDFNDNIWTRVEVGGPTARAWHAMAFDAETRSIILFGGGLAREEFTAETWIYDARANTWSQVS